MFRIVTLLLLMILFCFVATCGASPSSQTDAHTLDAVSSCTPMHTQCFPDANTTPIDAQKILPERLDAISQATDAINDESSTGRDAGRSTDVLQKDY